MSEIIADVSEDAAAKDCRSSVPIVVEDGMCQLVERRCEGQEKRGRHN